MNEVSEEVTKLVSEWENEVPLLGSPKQITWANDLRRTALKQLAEDSLQPLKLRLSWMVMKDSLQKSGGKAHGFNRGMKAKKLFAIIGQ